MWCCVWRTSRCLWPVHVEFCSRGECQVIELEMSRCGAAFGAHQDVSGLRMSSFVREASAGSLSFRCQGGALRLARIKIWCGAAFGAHQDVSGLRMSSFVQEASARSLSFRCQGVVLRLAHIKMSPACACRASFERRAQDHLASDVKVWCCVWRAS